jgi:hypothetical protein
VRKYFVGAAASTAVLMLGMGSAFAAGAPAPKVPSIADGFVSIAVGGAAQAVDFPGGSVSGNGVSLEGAAGGAYNFSATLGFQGDVVFGSQAYSGDIVGGETVNNRNTDVAIHAFYRNDQYLIGGFGQYSNNTYTFGDYGSAQSLDQFYGGVEGQVFFGNATLYGQAGAQQVRSFGESVNGIFGTLEARYFLEPNFKIEAHIGADTVGSSTSEIFDGDPITTLHAGAGAEYRLDNSPISFFAKYDYGRATFSEETNVSEAESRFLIGAKFNFESQTLVDRDRTGASLKPVDSRITGIFGYGP